MKYINKWYIACLAMAFCCLVSACSEDDVTPVEATFTAPGEFDMASLDSCESIVSSFEITSNGAWNLCSDKMWVKLSLQADGEFFNDVQGGEGTHTVYIKVSICVLLMFCGITNDSTKYIFLSAARRRTIPASARFSVRGKP